MCHKLKSRVYHPSRSTRVYPGNEQCIQISSPGNFQTMGCLWTEYHRCTCIINWSEMPTVSFPFIVKTLKIRFTWEEIYFIFIHVKTLEPHMVLMYIVVLSSSTETLQSVSWIDDFIMYYVCYLTLVAFMSLEFAGEEIQGRRITRHGRGIFLPQKVTYWRFLTFGVYLDLGKINAVRQLIKS